MLNTNDLISTYQASPSDKNFNPIFDVNSLSYGIEGFAVNPIILKIIN